MTTGGIMPKLSNEELITRVQEGNFWFSRRKDRSMWQSCVKTKNVYKNWQANTESNHV